MAKNLLLLCCNWLPPILWMAMIFYLSSLSGLPDFDTYDFTVKKAAHFSVYALLYLFLFRAFRLSFRLEEKPPLPALIVPAVVAVLYAISDEIHQSFVPMRNATVRDVFIDTAGILAMCVVVRKWFPFWAATIDKTQLR
jgi:VanZ family protein